MKDKNLEPLKTDFKKFLFVIWKYLNLPKPTKIQYMIADILQYSDSKNLIIEAFRGVGKSWITSTFIVWLLWKNQQLEILMVSASRSKALENAVFMKRLLSEIPFLNHLVADKRKGLRDAVESFDINGKRPSQAPSVKVAGITGQITGSRADIILGDDIEIPNNSFSSEARNKLLAQANEFVNILKPNGKIILLGTPQSEESIYTKLENTGEFKLQIIPVYYPTTETSQEQITKLADPLYLEYIKNKESLAGLPTDPQRFNEDIIIKRKSVLSTKEFKLQYLLDTSIADDDIYPLKIRDVIVYSCDINTAPEKLYWGNTPVLRYSDIPNLGLHNDGAYMPNKIIDNYLDYESKILVIDPSGKGSDETAYVILGLLGTTIHVLTFGGFTEGYSDEVLNKLAKLAKTYKVNKILTESNFGGGMFTKLLLQFLQKNGIHLYVEEVTSKTNKEKRIIDTLEPIFKQHKLVIDYQSLLKDTTIHRQMSDWHTYSLYYQITHISQEHKSIKHDDRLDALAMGVSYFIDKLGINEDKKLKQLKTSLKTKEYQEYLRDIGMLNKHKNTDIRMSYKQRLKKYNRIRRVI